MATNFPTSLDSYTTKVDNVDTVSASHINDPQDAIEALEAKVGIDDSSVVTSHDWLIAKLMFGNPRAKFAWKDADEIYINPGIYEINGKIVYWTSQLTKQLTSPSAMAWHYLYLDDSEISASMQVDTGDFVFSTTPPSWSNTKYGWYNGNDKCVFAVLTDNSSNIREFFHDGEFVAFADRVTDRTTADLDTTWVDVTLSIPAFTEAAQVAFICAANGDTANCTLYWRTDGQSAELGHNVAFSDASAAQQQYNSCRVIAANQVIEIKHSTTGAHKTGLQTGGWYFPIGM